MYSTCFVLPAAFLPIILCDHCQSIYDLDFKVKILEIMKPRIAAFARKVLPLLQFFPSSVYFINNVTLESLHSSRLDGKGGFGGGLHHALG
jgi:hypothetical protein